MYYFANVVSLKNALNKLEHLVKRTTGGDTGEVVEKKPCELKQNTEGHTQDYMYQQSDLVHQ